MKKICILLCIYFIFYSCDNPSSSIKDKKTLDSLVNKALNEGDEFAYGDVRSYFFLGEKPQDFCYYAIKMANKYDYPDAYYDVFISLTLSENIPIDSLDNKTKSLALYYLLKSRELGCKQAEYDIEKIFADTIPKSSLYLIEMAKE